MFLMRPRIPTISRFFLVSLSVLLLFAPTFSWIIAGSLQLESRVDIQLSSFEGSLPPRKDDFHHSLSILSQEVKISLYDGDDEDRSVYTGEASRAETKQFIVSGGYTITAELKRTGEHCYLYVEEGYVYYPENVAREFDEQIFPELTAKLGEPGDVDGDPRIYILYYNMGNNGIAGYFWPNDPNHLDITYYNLYYNVGADVVAHEFTHLVQNNYDTREERWIDEGLAEVATVHIYEDPERYTMMDYFEYYNTISLNWKAYSEDYIINFAQYGIAYVFQQYLYDQFNGIDSSGLVLRDGYSFDPADNTPYQGIAGIENFLNLTGSDTYFDSLFRNWTVANYLDNNQIGNGTWGYETLDISARPTEFVDDLPWETDRDINGYAVNYIRLNRTDKPTTVTLTVGKDMSVALIHKSASGEEFDLVEIMNLDAGINVFDLESHSPEWDHIAIDVINHKDQDGSYGINITEVLPKPPVAVAGDDAMIRAGDTVHFNANASFHPDEREIIKYLWDFQDDGTFDSEGIKANFSYAEEGIFTVRLLVEDDMGLNSTDTLSVSVENRGSPPTARIWVSERQPVIYEEVTLDGSNSTDPDDEKLYFSWDLNDDGVGDISGAVIGAHFEEPGKRTISLNVTDARGDSDVERIEMYVRDNTAPVAVAPSDMEINQWESIEITGEGSFDMDGHSLSYQWSMGDDVRYGEMIQWDFPDHGTFLLTLKVTDAVGAEDTDTLLITVNGVPVIDVAVPEEIRAEEPVTFDAGDTRDPENDRLSYRWSMDGIELSKEKGPVLEFVFPRGGPVEIILKVTDSRGAGSVETFHIDVLPPVELKMVDISYPSPGEIVREKIKISGGNGDNGGLDTIYITVDNGPWREAEDLSSGSDWSTWRYKLDVRRLSIGSHVIHVFGSKGERITPYTAVKVHIMAEEEEKYPDKGEDDHDYPEPEDTLNRNDVSSTDDALFYFIPLCALLFLILVVAVLIYRRSAQKREIKRLVAEMLEEG